MTRPAKRNFKKEASQMTFESALERLESIVETLSSQKINLDSMIDLYEEGVVLKEHCAKKLDEAQMKIETVSKKGQTNSSN